MVRIFSLSRMASGSRMPPVVFSTTSGMRTRMRQPLGSGSRFLVRAICSNIVMPHLLERGIDTAMREDQAVAFSHQELVAFHGLDLAAQQFGTDQGQFLFKAAFQRDGEGLDQVFH